MVTGADLWRRVHGLTSKVAASLAPLRWKRFNELRYWKGRKKIEGSLSGLHYQRFYTSHFGLAESFYRDKVIVDIGCGPRGSLEWAHMAARRIGVDPLAEDYLRLGATAHRMEYLCAPAEHIPLPAGECDVVFSFNSLDHVEDVEKVIDEVKRITRPLGMLLLLVEVNHPPTDCEPHELTPGRVIELLRPEFQACDVRVYRPVKEGMYESINADQRVPSPESTGERGYLSARFIRQATA